MKNYCERFPVKLILYYDQHLCKLGLISLIAIFDKYMASQIQEI